MNMMRWWIVWLAGIAAGTPMCGCGGNGDTIGGSGLLEADDAIISAETSGQVKDLFFTEGTRVLAGDTLLVIDPSRVELELESALAGRKVARARLETSRFQLDQAQEAERYVRSERDRVTTLVKSGTSTQKQLDQLEHELTSAELGRKTARANIAALDAELARIDADINRLRRQLQDCYPVSPIAGVVTEKYIDAGELLVPGRPVARVARLDTVYVKVYLPTAAFASVSIGDQATVDTESGGRQYRGAVVWTSEEAEFTPKNVQTRESRTNLVYAVKIRVANSDGRLKVGMPVFVTIEK